MNRKVLSIAVLAGALTWACGEPAAGPDATLRPSLMADGVPEDVPTRGRTLTLGDHGFRC